MGITIDMTGKKIGRLTVISEAPRRKRLAEWLCRCDCGNEVIVLGHSLRSGKTKSCGCLQRDRAREAGGKNKIHGDQGSRLYDVWLGMKSRCYNPNVHNYSDYGGRGIRVCDEWIHDYPKFKEWAIANGYDWGAPKGKCTLDRIDVNGDYEPSNCRWADMFVQNRNKRVHVDEIMECVVCGQQFAPTQHGQRRCQECINAKPKFDPQRHARYFELHGHR